MLMGGRFHLYVILNSRYGRQTHQWVQGWLRLKTVVVQSFHTTTFHMFYFASWNCWSKHLSLHFSFMSASSLSLLFSFFPHLHPKRMRYVCFSFRLWWFLTLNMWRSIFFYLMKAKGFLHTIHTSKTAESQAFMSSNSRMIAHQEDVRDAVKEPLRWN